MSLLLMVIGLFLLFFPAIINDRTITGIVIDSISGQPLKGATVQYNKSKVISDADGWFMITVPLNITYLTINFDGYKKKILPIDKKTEHANISLLKIKNFSKSALENSN